MSRYEGMGLAQHLSEITQSLEEKFTEITRGEVPTYAKLVEMSETERSDYMKAMDAWQTMSDFIRSREEAQYGREQREFTGAAALRDFLVRDNKIRPKIKEIYDELAKEEDRKLSSEGGPYAVAKTDTKGRLTDYWNKVDRSLLPPGLKSSLSSFDQATEDAFEEMVKDRFPTMDQLREMETAKQKGFYNAALIFNSLLDYTRTRNEKKGYTGFGRAEKEVTGCQEFRKFEEKGTKTSLQRQAILDDGERITNL